MGTHTNENSTGRSSTPRRRFLQAVGGTVGAASLAGCTGIIGGSGGGGSGNLADTLVIQMEGGSMLDALESEAFDQFQEEYGVEIQPAERVRETAGRAGERHGPENTSAGPSPQVGHTLCGMPPRVVSTVRRPPQSGQ